MTVTEVQDDQFGTALSVVLEGPRSIAWAGRIVRTSDGAAFFLPSGYAALSPETLRSLAALADGWRP